MANEPETDTILTKDLDFDRANPRLAEYGVTPQTSDDQIIKILWDAMDVRELVQSIAASGFFPHETLIVASEKGKNIVIEGNRRLAAVRVLLNDQIAKENGWELPKISAAIKSGIEQLPVIRSNRKDAWRYLGFKHVNGPAKWSSYAKAKYVADIHNTYNISLADIADQIGDQHRTVERLFRGLMVLEQARREKVYDSEDRFRQRLAFSHLYTGLDYDGISSFVSLKPEDGATKNPIPKDKVKELGELCIWLYGSKKTNTPPVINTQNPDLRQLNDVLKNREAVAALRAGSDLAKAFEISRPPESVFEEALLAAKRDLTTARANLTTGYDRSDELLRIAGTIANMADDIYSEMARKQDPEKKKLRISEK
jgi:hypothetical protein